MLHLKKKNRIDFVISPSQLRGASPVARDVAIFVAASPPAIPSPIAMGAIGARLVANLGHKGIKCFFSCLFVSLCPHVFAFLQIHFHTFNAGPFDCSFHDGSFR